jgi:hypothetical protein
MERRPMKTAATLVLIATLSGIAVAQTGKPAPRDESAVKARAELKLRLQSETDPTARANIADNMAIAAQQNALSDPNTLLADASLAVDNAITTSQKVINLIRMGQALEASTLLIPTSASLAAGKPDMYFQKNPVIAMAKNSVGSEKYQGMKEALSEPYFKALALIEQEHIPDGVIPIPTWQRVRLGDYSPQERETPEFKELLKKQEEGIAAHERVQDQMRIVPLRNTIEARIAALYAMDEKPGDLQKACEKFGLSSEAAEKLAQRSNQLRP